VPSATPAAKPADTVPVDGRTARRQRGRAAVIEAVVDLLSEGHVPPTTAEVVARAGISEATLFRNFGRLDDLQLEASTTFLARHAHLFEIPEIGQGPLDARIERLVVGRAALWEVIGPVVRLGRSRAVDNPELADLLRTSRLAQIDQVKTHFAPELTALTPTQRTDRAAVIASITGFESWDLHRHDLSRSTSRVHLTWSGALTALLGPTPVEATAPNRAAGRKNR
jgi:AcrR family transcriptional regulator